jgi:hypothetical protein
MYKWQLLPEFVPANAQTVWIRCYGPFYTSFKAVYDSAAQTFTDIAHGIIYPAYTVYKWKHI